MAETEFQDLNIKVERKADFIHVKLGDLGELWMTDEQSVKLMIAIAREIQGYTLIRTPPQ